MSYCFQFSNSLSRIEEFHSLSFLNGNHLPAVAVQGILLHFHLLLYFISVLMMSMTAKITFPTEIDASPLPSNCKNEFLNGSKL